MCVLLFYLVLYKCYKWMLSFGIVLVIVMLFVSIGLLIFFGWFFLVLVVVGVVGLYSFNYMLFVVGVCGVVIICIVGCYFECLVSYDVIFCVLQYLCIYIFSKLLFFFFVGLVCYCQGELFNCVVVDVDMFDYFYLCVILLLVGVFVVIMVVIIGLSFFDFIFVFMLGGIMLLMFFLMLLLFYCVGKSIG